MTFVMKFDIEKFDGKIYFSIWHVQMMAVLIQHGLKKALGGMSSMPVTMTDEQWNELDEKALSAIQLCLSKEVLQEVIKEEIATGLWLKLEGLYTMKSLINKLHLKERLYTLKMAEGDFKLFCENEAIARHHTIVRTRSKIALQNASIGQLWKESVASS
uniref:Uncharacterized protein n=1 Tax=Opuntia streptacantha TaxID=393608 RepID=A0A7C9DXJ7_OPUST